MRNNGSDSKGKLFVVGIGPAGADDRTHRAEQAIGASDVVVGYGRYLDNIKDITGGKELVSSGMTKETERCREALRRAEEGKVVSLVSSGDAGVYGMAGLAIELCKEDKMKVDIEIIPGVTAASSAGALLGAPLSLDFACISLSDLLVPWETIKKRLTAVAQADLVVALYNPRSKKRVKQLSESVEIFRLSREGDTPAGICTNVGYEDERVIVTTLGALPEEDIGMKSIVIIGNSSSLILDGRFITPRGYKGKRF